jgi:4-amino-4-deoxy-L-arabinose transferase-like glycosyltransferase
MRPSPKRWLHAPELWLALAVLVQLGITIWWIATDTHTPDAESARQIGFAFAYTDKIDAGDLLASFHGTHSAVQDLYPPIHGTLAALWGLAFGKSISGALVVQLLVYFPLIVVGSYGAGRALYGRTGGVLAAVFMLAVPVFGPIFHIYLVDTATLAFAAPAIWLLLESRRFERRWWALAAGIVVGLGMLTKTNFAFVWPGIAAVMLIRGGWRHWANVLIFAAAVAVVAAPWYLSHTGDLRNQIDFYSAGDVATYTPPLGNLRFFSLRHLSYYPRVLMEVDVYLPLLLFFAVGGVVSIVRFVVRRAPRDDYTPELVVGLLVFWFGLLNVNQADWRFALAGLVYVALFSTGWLVSLPRPALIAAGVVLGLLFLANTVMTNFGLGKKVSVAVHGVSATVVSGQGIVVNKPNGISRLQDGLLGLQKQGFKRYYVFGPSESPPDFELAGVGTMANIAGMTFIDQPRLPADTVAVLSRGVRPGDPPPCSWLTDRKLGSGGIYFVRGPVTTKQLQDVTFGAPLSSVHVVCPR